MAILQQKPVTPSGRFFLKNKQELSKKRPEKALTSGHHRKKAGMHMVELLAEGVVADTRDYIAKSISGVSALMNLLR